MLYIIRHGRTDWNDEYRLQGQTDIPLNEEGREMAREAAEKYRDIHFDICFCSPLIRAAETARILLEGRDIPVYYDDRLKELAFGECEGLENSLGKPESPVYVFFKEPEKYTDPPKGGESLDELFLRTGEFLRERVEPLLSEAKDVLIVGHGAMNSSIVCQVKDRDRSRFWEEGIPNCELMRLI